MNWKKAISSRKFLTSLFGALLIALDDAMGLNLSEEDKMLIAGILASFILGESVADAAGARGAKNQNG